MKKGEEKEMLHFPFHSPFRGCLRSVLAFGLNAHTFYFPYCALNTLCGVTVLAGEYPIALQGPALSPLNCTRVSRSLFSGGSLSRGQEGGNPLCHRSLLTVTRSAVPAAARKVKLCHCVISKSSDLWKSLVWDL